MGKGTKVISPEKIKVDKKCSCGKLYPYLPEGTLIMSGLYWWDCSCKNTLAAKVKDVE